MGWNFKILFLISALSVGVPAHSAPAPSTSEELSEALLGEETDPASVFISSIWRTGDGLPVNDIQDVQETPDGYLWLGTFQGLVRFDGVRFESFFTTPAGDQFGTRSGPLELDGQGNLWIALDEAGIVRLSGGVFCEVVSSNAVLKDRVVSLCRDGTNGMMWVDADGGIGRISIKQPSQPERIPGGGASGSSRCVRDYQGNIWLANTRNLKLRREDGKWRDMAVPGTASLVVAPRRDGGMWIARDAKLHFILTNGVTTEVAAFPWKGESKVTRILEDKHRRLWIGTVARGLYCYSGGEFKNVVPMTSSILCLLEDEQDNVWAGTRGGGLVRVRERQFFMRDLRSGLKDEFVRSLSQDQSGRVWLLSEGGLGWWQDDQWYPVGELDGWPDIESLCVLPRRDGSVWVSTRRGIWRWQDGKFKKKELGPKAPKEPVADFLEDRQGRLWMVTDNSGLYCLQGNVLTHHLMAQGLPSNLMRRIIEDEAGELWAGDWEGGIARLKGNRWEIVRPNSGHRDAVRSMVSADGALWIGTSAGGLLRLKNGKTNRVSVEQGLPDVCIQQLILDGQGSLWGGTPHKLFRVSMQQLNAVMNGSEPQVDAIIYGRSDGLPDVSFAAWCDPRSWRTTNGELWLATANGAIHFQPANLRESKPPQVLIERTLLNGKAIEKSALQELRPGAGRLEFHFTAPCLTAPERVRFRYQMSGVDSEWVEAGSTRTATYTGMPAGNHIFRVMASSPEGVWSSQTAAVSLEVHPYIWQTSWFFALVAATTAGGAAWTVRRTTVRRLQRRVELLRQQRSVDQERTRIAQDIHDELGANLTSIGLMADMGRRHQFDPAAINRELEQISKTARESVAAMDAIVWALNPGNDSLDHFANYVAQFTREFFRPTELRTRLEIPADLPAQPMATETRHQLFLIVKESFNNIVRHAEATEVNLELVCHDGQLRLTIADNGKGLSAKTVSAGQDGLANLRDRIEQLGGTLRMGTNKGGGTRLEFVLPMSRLSPK